MQAVMRVKAETYVTHAEKEEWIIFAYK